jgi:peptide methionine sulfoxide reductase MsrA
VGYIGGSETVQVDYDPVRVSYQQLLDAFWAGHNPTFPNEDWQYRSAIFYHTEGQKEKAIESKSQKETSWGSCFYGYRTEGSSVWLMTTTRSII